MAATAPWGKVAIRWHLLNASSPWAVTLVILLEGVALPSIYASGHIPVKQIETSVEERCIPLDGVSNNPGVQLYPIV